MRFLSVCSGIDAASVAWHPLGWRAVAFAEIEPAPCAVLAHHYPDVPNLGDLTRWREWPEALLVEADLLVGGTPCQSFSVAGLRRGLDDERGNLALEFVRLANAIDHLRRVAGRPPLWILWENVPGVFSDAGNAFGAFVGGLVGSDAAVEPPRGRGWSRSGVVSGPARCAAWRCLDAQHFGLAQRRDRIFVLARGGAGDWSAPDALLPVTASLRWHPAPRREAGEGVAGWPSERAGTLDAHYGDKWGLENQHIDNGAPNYVAHTLRADGHDASEDGTGRGTPLVPLLADPITANEGNTYAQAGNNPGKLHNVVGLSSSVTPAVRRLTPRECERLQGFDDDYTLVPYRGKPMADGPRYRMLGNSMAVPVMRHIGQRIEAVERAHWRRHA